MSAHAQLDDTTIVAAATPPGRGGVGIVRLSGSRALAIAGALFPTRTLTPRQAHYAVLRDTDGARVDDAVVLHFPAPHSYTGEDVVEISVHGSPVVLDWLLRFAVEHGATPARAGEFTERAYLHGKLDLTGAEAVRDLIDAQTMQQARLAAEQVGGSVAAAVRPAKDTLIALIAEMEAGIDFAEDDIDTLPAGEMVRRMRPIRQELEALQRSFIHGRLLRDGLQLAIVGRPNVGKSSLFNRLADRDRSIVTAAAGTTRDVVAERVNMDGIPVELLDTAGLRDTADEAERQGVERSLQALADADAVVVVHDSSLPYLPDERLEALLEGRPVIRVANKCDLPTARTPQPGFVQASAATGEGMADVRAAILKLAGANQDAGSATLTNARQHAAVQRATAALAQAAAAAQINTPHEMLLLDLYSALDALDQLTGQTTPDDVLALIFSSFCIGK